ncbi:MAG TPA: sulfatase-like hydrolase/transferase, partial [Rhodothermales bacterium]|nr:sulfatase-like hydrolase/transferase [Rhodothermales bacterium]
WRNQTWEATKNGYFSPHQKLQGDPADPAAYALFKGMDYATDMFGAEALRFIEAHQEQPFFLYLPYTAPHLALQAPDEAIAEYEGIFEEIPYIGDKGYLPHPKPKAAYAAMITRMDQQIGKMLQLLKKLDLDQNTLVIFTSDNGASFKMGGFDPDFFEANGPLRGYKQDLLEGGIRVPFIARWPGVIAPNTTSDHVAANWDVFATVAELIQKPLRNVQEGVSFLPLLTGIGIQQTHEWLYWEFPEVKNGIQAVRWGKWKGIRTGWMKNPDAPIALYNLDTDLAELHDVAAQHPDVVAFLKTLLAKRKTAALSNWNPSY